MLPAGRYLNENKIIGHITHFSCIVVFLMQQLQYNNDVIANDKDDSQHYMCCRLDQLTCTAVSPHTDLTWQLCTVTVGMG